jgi:hypothetical protein
MACNNERGEEAEPTSPQPSQGKPTSPKKKKRTRQESQYSEKEIEQRREARRTYARKKNGIKLGQYVIELRGQYRQPTGGKTPKWGELSTAKVYKSEGIARMAQENIGAGQVRKVEG